jgi:uncharacterized protein YcbX
MEVGHVREIWRYPVKSMAGERLDRGHVGPQGLWGDRGWAIRDEATGEIHNAKRHPILMQCSAVYRAEPRAEHVPHVDIRLPNGTTVSSDSPGVAQRLSDLMGRRVTLRPLQPAADTAYYRRPEPGSALLGRHTYFDLFPIHVLTTSALQLMSRLNPAADWTQGGSDPTSELVRMRYR